MARKKKKLISIRKPKLKVTKKGIKVTKPSARVGGKVGVNVSSKGMSGSVRTGKGHVNISKKGVRGRVGGKAGVNFGKQGINPTVRKPRKKGCRRLFSATLLLTSVIFGLILIAWGKNK